MNPYWNLNLEWAIPMAVLVVGLVVGPTWLLTRRAASKAKWSLRVAALIVAVANPLSGWVVWEPVNKHLLGDMKSEAERVGLEGKSFAEIEALFGAPGFVWGPNDAHVVTWNYPRPAFYVLGSTFQVHFKEGVVYGWEPFDD